MTIRDRKVAAPRPREAKRIGAGSRWIYGPLDLFKLEPAKRAGILGAS